MSSSTTVSRLHRIRNAYLIASVLYHSLLPLSTLQVTQKLTFHLVYMITKVLEIRVQDQNKTSSIR